MSDSIALLLLSPLLLLILGAVIVIVVALCRAAPGDVPTVLHTACSILGGLADRLPHNVQRHGPLDNCLEQDDPDEVSGEELDW